MKKIYKTNRPLLLASGPAREGMQNSPVFPILSRQVLRDLVARMVD